MGLKCPKAFFGPFLCVKAFFGPFLCGRTSQKKTLAVRGRACRFLVRLFSDLSGIVLCQAYGFPLDLGLQCPKAFFGPFLCAKAFFGPFLCGRTPKKNLGSEGGGRVVFWPGFFQTFLE